MHRFIVFVPALCVQRGVEWGVINVTLDVWALLLRHLFAPVSSREWLIKLTRRASSSFLWVPFGFFLRVEDEKDQLQ